MLDKINCLILQFRLEKKNRDYNTRCSLQFVPPVLCHLTSTKNFFDMRVVLKAGTEWNGAEPIGARAK